MLFYLGVHRPQWLAEAGVPLFLSYATMKTVKALPRAIDRWALDSGAWSQMAKGGWDVTAKTYAAAIHRFRSEVGNLDWAAPQDWLCDPGSLAATGKTVAEHQRLTLENYLDLRSLGAPVIPVLQGWSRGEYLDHAEAYAKAGVNLQKAPIVGIGSIKTRQTGTMVATTINWLKSDGIRLHGFGMSLAGLGHLAASGLASADSSAWSAGARFRRDTGGPNALSAALAWQKQVVEKLQSLGVSTNNGGTVTAHQIAAGAKAARPAKRLPHPPPREIPSRPMPKPVEPSKAELWAAFERAATVYYRKVKKIGEDAARQSPEGEELDALHAEVGLHFSEGKIAKVLRDSREPVLTRRQQSESQQSYLAGYRRRELERAKASGDKKRAAFLEEQIRKASEPQREWTKEELDAEMANYTPVPQRGYEDEEPEDDEDDESEQEAEASPPPARGKRHTTRASDAVTRMMESKKHIDPNKLYLVEHPSVEEKLVLELSTVIERQKDPKYVTVSMASQKQAAAYYNKHGFAATLTHLHEIEESLDHPDLVRGYGSVGQARAHGVRTPSREVTADQIIEGALPGKPGKSDKPESPRKTPAPPARPSPKPPAAAPVRAPARPPRAAQATRAAPGRRNEVTADDIVSGALSGLSGDVADAVRKAMAGLD